jgi:hypothetical protein
MHILDFFVRQTVLGVPLKGTGKMPLRPLGRGLEGNATIFAELEV